MDKLHNYSEWGKINEKENASLFNIFSSLATGIGFAVISSFTSLILLYTTMFKKKPERLSLIFPKAGWETKAVNLLKRLGVITGVFKSTIEAIQYLKILKNKGIKVKELVIGSHGDGKTLLITQKKDEKIKKYSNNFLINAKDIISRDTKVFFTACYGADYLMNLVDAANKLGVGVYGSRGIYNYITNTSEKGYYYCKPYQVPEPKNKTEPRDEFYSGKLEMDQSQGAINFKFFGSFGFQPKLKIEFNPSSFYDLGWKFQTYSNSKKSFSFFLSQIKIETYKEDYGTKDGQPIWSYSFYFSDSLFKQQGNLNDIGFKELSFLLGKKDFYNTGRSEDFSAKLKKSILKGHIKLSIGGIDLSKERPKIRGYRVSKIFFSSNENLLSCGACKKVYQAPISWINP